MFVVHVHVYREGENEMWYYSTKPQLEELLEVLDDRNWENDLVRTLEDMRSEIENQMEITEELTNENKGNKKTAIDLELCKLKINMLCDFILIGL